MRIRLCFKASFSRVRCCTLFSESVAPWRRGRSLDSPESPGPSPCPYLSPAQQPHHSQVKLAQPFLLQIQLLLQLLQLGRRKGDRVEHLLPAPSVSTPSWVPHLSKNELLQLLPGPLVLRQLGGLLSLGLSPR